MKLYHGTTISNLTKILSKGIQCRALTKKKSHWKECPSKDQFVYLTTSYPLYFANAAAKRKDTELLIVEVETDDANLELFPDEDFIGQAIWASNHADARKLKKGFSDLFELTNSIDVTAYQHAWEESLEHLGNCCCRLAIPKNCLVRYATIDREKCKGLIFGASDPTITLMNYRFCGEYYRSLVKFIFEGERFQHFMMNDFVMETIEKERAAGIKVYSVK